MRTIRVPARTNQQRRVERLGQVATVIMWVMMLFSAGINILGIAPPFTAAGGLGYPEYVPRMLGVAKLLGCATFLTSRVPRLREWAYAGFTFELLGAAVSHAVVGTGVLHVAAPLFDLGFVLVSYVAWHRATLHVPVLGTARHRELPFHPRGMYGSSDL